MGIVRRGNIIIEHLLKVEVSEFVLPETQPAELLGKGAAYPKSTSSLIYRPAPWGISSSVGAHEEP